MADPLAEFKNPYQDKPFRQPIADLAKLITDRVPVVLGKEQITIDSPEYIGLQSVCSDEEAKVAILMEKRKPRTMSDMIKITGKTEAELKPILENLSYNGVIEWNYENPQHEKQWVLPMFVPGSAEFGNMNAKLLEAHPELGHFFERMSRLPLEKITPHVPEGGAGIGMHVIPVEKAIEGENKSISLEHISYWLDKYDGHYASSPCSCRRSRKTFGEGCADDPEGWCIAMGDMADYVVETGKGGRYITKEEALEIFKKAEDNGFVHQITNIDGENKIFAICNCNINVCYALRTSQLFNTPNMSRSAYVAEVTKQDCVACGRCVEYCPAGAVKLGQKLCKKDGKEVKYPRMPTPDQKKWGPHMWSEDYRDRNRINCYDTGTAPCKTNCPAHIGIQGYLKMAAQGRYTEALALIKKENPFPAVCGHVCNRRCEDACTRGTVDQAIAIDEVKKFIAMRDLNAETRYIPPKVVPSLSGKFDEKVAIIGAGPAGLSCAFYLAEKGYKPTVFEKNALPGGMLVYGIPSFVLEKNVVAAEIDIMKEMGVEIKTGVEVGKDISISDLRKQGYKAFYIAIGCQSGRKVGVPGEDAKGVWTGIDFLHACGEEKTTPKFSGPAVVIGGGNVAVDAARCVVRCGASEIHMVSLETRDIMPASPEEIEIAESEDIKLNGGWGPKEILTKDGKVTGIVFKKCVSVFDTVDGKKKFAPKYDENETMKIECNNVILTVGQASVWGDLLKGENAEFKGPAIQADPQTYQVKNCPDIFVGGDVYTGPKFAIDAIAAGKEAAISIHRFVQPGCTLTIGRNKRQFIELNKEDITLPEGYDTSSRQIPGKDTSFDTKKSFRDAKLVFTEEQVKKETARCLSCGASVVDPNKCIGCGVCTTKCGFDAIKLYRKNPKCSTMRKSEDKLKYILPVLLKHKIKFAFKK